LQDVVITKVVALGVNGSLPRALDGLIRSNIVSGGKCTDAGNAAQEFADVYWLHHPAALAFLRR
jgi:hypothetical protein